MLPLHHESRATVPASAANVFSYLDDHKRLSKHMTKSSWMMAGSSMSIQVDAAQGREVGSKISLSGRVLGIPLSVDEVVIERRPPLRKVWQTEGVPHLLVMGPYRMGFDIEPQGESSVLCVFIEYVMPSNSFGRWFSFLGKFYARWCTQQMTDDAAANFKNGFQG
ncbi:MAG: SRPBCC family protein [Steroidobacteraceae bacterium]